LFVAITKGRVELSPYRRTLYWPLTLSPREEGPDILRYELRALVLQTMQTTILGILMFLGVVYFQWAS
jgi:hypothetical protein